MEFRGLKIPKQAAPTRALLCSQADCRNDASLKCKGCLFAPENSETFLEWQKGQALGTDE